MTISDWLLILSVFFSVFTSPFVAVLVNTHLERKRAVKERKLSIFKTLMATRAYFSVVSHEHVRALNMIDIEFGKDAKSTDVIEAWKIYRDHLNYNEGLKSNSEVWQEKSTHLLADLLKKMAITLNYKFDEVDLKRGMYSPQGHVEMEADKIKIREGLVSLLSGVKNLPITISSQINQEDAEKEWKKLSELIEKYLSKEIPIKVIIVSAEQETTPEGA